MIWWRIWATVWNYIDNEYSIAESNYKRTGVNWVDRISTGRSRNCRYLNVYSMSFSKHPDSTVTHFCSETCVITYSLTNTFFAAFTLKYFRKGLNNRSSTLCPNKLEGYLFLTSIWEMKVHGVFSCSKTSLKNVI